MFKACSTLTSLLVLSLLAVSQTPQAVPPSNGPGALPVFTEIAKQAGVAYRITCGDEVTEYLIDVNGQGAGLS